jgi:hypothetical protein
MRRRGGEDDDERDDVVNEDCSSSSDFCCDSVGNKGDGGAEESREWLDNVVGYIRVFCTLDRVKIALGV